MPTTPPPPTPTPCRRESVTPWSLLSHLDLAAAVSPWLLVATVGETHARPTCRHCHWLLDLPSPASLLQPSQFTGIYFSLFLQISKPNKMFLTLWFENMRFIESRNCACVVRTCGLVVFDVWVFCACVVNCDDIKGRPNTKRKKQIIYYRKLSHKFKKLMVILILFVDYEKINYNAWFFQKKMFKLGLFMLLTLRLWL